MIISHFRLSLFIIFAFNLVAVMGQDMDFIIRNFPGKEKELTRAIEKIEQGDDALDQRDYSQALLNYLQAYEFNPSFSLLNYKIGVCYLNSVSPGKAIPYFEKAAQLNPKIQAEVFLHLATAFQLTYEFEKAIQYLKKYRALLSPESLALKSKQIEKSIEECNTGITLMQKPVRVGIQNLGLPVNSKYPDYGPIINADESVLFFTSRREDTYGGKYDAKNMGYFEDIYVSYFVDNHWTEPYNPGPPLNTPFHDAIIGLSPDGQRLLLYKGKHGGDIYECVLNGNQWSKPVKLPKPINTKYHEPSASFCYDGLTIYFVSNRPGGYGGSDIYMCKRDFTGKWGQVVNLGATVNTPEDEDAVFMHPDGKTLYFSSKGHKTMGGYDIFFTVFENGKWSEPENLGYPINTPADDVFFSLSADGRHGYFSSSREDGIGEQDIYQISFFGPEKQVVNNTEDNLVACLANPVAETVIEPRLKLRSSELTLLKGFVKDAITLQPLQATIELVDNSKNQVIATFQSNKETGKYLVTLPSGKNYGIAVKCSGYLFHSENFDITESNEFRIVEKDIPMKKVAVGSEIALHNIFFDFAKADIRKESKTELDRLVALLKQYPKLKIEIWGHTDNIGTAEFNMDLSLQRAKAVANYLVANGITMERLSWKGFGFEKPVSDNETEEGRQKNRRVEFIIIEE